MLWMLDTIWLNWIELNKNEKFFGSIEIDGFLSAQKWTLFFWLSGVQLRLGTVLLFFQMIYTSYTQQYSHVDITSSTSIQTLLADYCW